LQAFSSMARQWVSRRRLVGSAASLVRIGLSCEIPANSEFCRDFGLAFLRGGAKPAAGTRFIALPAGHPLIPNREFCWAEQGLHSAEQGIRACLMVSVHFSHTWRRRADYDLTSTARNAEEDSSVEMAGGLSIGA
jgi:hypothetical protein